MKELSWMNNLHPVFFEEISDLNQCKTWNREKEIYFLVHGFLGESADMWMIKNEISWISKKIKIIWSDVNEN